MVQFRRLLNGALLVPFGGEAKFYFALISYTIYCLAYTAEYAPIRR